MISRVLLLAVALGLAAPSAHAQRTGLPGPVLPDGLGCNIHFTDPRPGEMEMLAAGGFSWVRMDFGWESTETAPGRYDFAPYDRLMAALDRYRIRPVFILDYSNRLYDDGQSPRTDEGRAAFARWAAAAARHFAGRGVIWEMYNEPNIGFWRPHPNVDEYAKLALAVGKALRAAEPSETYVGPATSTIDMHFLEACFRAGLLDYWSAVSVHPYRQSAPETAEAEYRQVRALIARYAPAGKNIPILSGEWGYSSAWNGVDEQNQSRYLAREWLTNVESGVPLSIWYDWHEDGTDPKESEHHFGTVRYAYHAGRRPVYDPKPAYVAARTLTSQLRGFRFDKRLLVASDQDHVLLFRRGADVKLVAWTEADGSRTAAVPASDGQFNRVDHLGGRLQTLTATSGSLAVPLTAAPIYLAPVGHNPVLGAMAAWRPLPREMRVRAGTQVGVGFGLTNTSASRLPVRVTAVLPDGGRTAANWALAPHATASRTFAVTVSRSPAPQPVRMAVSFGRGPAVAQSTDLIATNPLDVTVYPAAGGELTVRVADPAGEPFSGTVRLLLRDASPHSPTEPAARLDIRAGEPGGTVRFPVDPGPGGSYVAGVRVLDSRDQVALEMGPRRYALVAPTLDGADRELPFAIYADGDPKVASEQTIEAALPPPGLPERVPGALRVSYRFDAGWKFLRVAPATDAMRAIPGRPAALGMWVYGDGSDNLVRARFVDATGQTFQPDGDALHGKGWRFITLPLDGSRAGHWGGANDGVVHYPIRWDTLFLLDSAHQSACSGTVYVAAPVVIE